MSSQGVAAILGREKGAAARARRIGAADSRAGKGVSAQPIAENGLPVLTAGKLGTPYHKILYRIEMCCKKMDLDCHMQSGIFIF